MLCLEQANAYCIGVLHFHCREEECARRITALRFQASWSAGTRHRIHYNPASRICTDDTIMWHPAQRHDSYEHCILHYIEARAKNRRKIKTKWWWRKNWAAQPDPGSCGYGKQVADLVDRFSTRAWRRIPLSTSYRGSWLESSRQFCCSHRDSCNICSCYADRGYR